MDWMGNQIDTLDDLLPVPVRAVCVGINPAPVSVAAGHYFQGRQGQRFFARLRQAGVLLDPRSDFEDDDAFACGIGFTDVVKRPTPSAKDVSSVELRHGADHLAAKL